LSLAGKISLVIVYLPALKRSNQRLEIFIGTLLFGTDINERNDLKLTASDNDRIEFQELFKQTNYSICND
jgi:hypothetical protein